jgi:hypothetical protein
LNPGYSGSLTVGQIVPMRDSNSRSIELSTPAPGTAQTATFNLNDVGFAGTATIIAAITVNQQPWKTKSLSNYTIKIIGTGLNTVKGNKDTLSVSDLYDVAGIYNTGTTNPTSVTVDPITGELTWGSVSYTDVKSNYEIDDGQRAELYDHASLRLIGSAPGASDYILVVYRNFAHSGTGFFSVDSYSSLSYTDIPVFTDPATGEITPLRDVIDFRPRRVDGSTALIGGQVPDPTNTFDTSFSYYLGRFDKIVATSDRSFVVTRGVPALNPLVPVDVANGMTIYVLAIPPYTSDVRDIQIKYIDNRRYTMRDIGRLDKRIRNLEYYTQLSLLEKQAKDTSIPDATNQEKFKNGFVTDPFTSQDIFVANASAWSQRRWGWWQAWFNGSESWSSGAQNYNQNSIAWPAHSDFNCAIDPLNQELRAPFIVDYYEFNTGELVNTVRAGDIVSLNYTEQTVINQPLASSFINVNPFNVIRFLGNIRLEPSFDQWVETESLPAINQVVDVRLPDASAITVFESTGVFHAGLIRTVTDSTTTIETTELSRSTGSLGTNVVDLQVVPFIRAKTIIGVSKSFKPNTQLYSFLENVLVSQFIKPLTLIEVQNHVGRLFTGDIGNYEDLTFRTGSATGSVTGTAKTALYSQPTTLDNTKRLLSVYSETGTFTVGQYVVGTSGNFGIITKVTTYSLGDDLVPDEYGDVGFQFNLPGNTFRTGERTLRLIDNLDNDTQTQSSIGEAKYTASGIIQSKQETILTTRLVQDRQVTRQTGYYYDPLAQSFVIEDIAYPVGFHVSSVDLYFKTKSNTVPLTVQIRRTVNGYPKSISDIPFAEVIVSPENIVVSELGNVATNVRFPNPIHLSPGEYALVILANTQEYTVFFAEIGQTVFKGTSIIDKQPYIGSFFISQNASTWESDSNKDLKFKLNRAQFVSSGTAEFEIEDPESIKDYQTLFTNIGTANPTGTKIVWQAKSYNADDTWNDGDWAEIDINQDVNYANLRRLASKDGITGGELGNAVTPSLRIRAVLSTENPIVSPLIDASSLSIIAAVNTINNDSTGEDGKFGGNALARYITKPINLADGFDASNICVTVDVNKPAGTNIKVYFKTLPAEATTPIDDENWQEMVLERAVSNSSNNYDYKEHRYFPTGAFEDGIPVDDGSIIEPRVNSFQIKIVLLSITEATTPKLKDLRIIALDN